MVGMSWGSDDARECGAEDVILRPRHHASISLMQLVPTELDDEDRIRSGWKPWKGEATRFREARNGDDLLLSFECKTCIFSKLYRRLPFEGNNTETDGFAMG